MARAVQAAFDAWEFTPPKKKDGTACFAAVALAQEFFPTGDRGDVPVTDSARDILQWLAKKPEKIVELSALDRLPLPVSRRPPVYPSALLQADRAGDALVEFFIDEHGDAQLPHVVSCTEPEFGAAGVQAVAAWRYEPPLRGGKAVTVRARIPLHFEPILKATKEAPAK